MLEPPCSPIELRILGALAEKAVITPDTYPLSLAGLIAACNQATSRDPVMQLDEDSVMQGVVSLRRRSLVRAIQPSGSRVTKYSHLLDETLNLDARDVALLAVLMLRGEQTVAELFARGSRLAAFADANDVEAVLDGLCHRQPEALALRLPRRPGQKEQRMMHLMGGMPSAAPPSTLDTELADLPTVPAPERLTVIEGEVASLRSEVAELRAAFESFRQQFG